MIEPKKCHRCNREYEETNLQYDTYPLCCACVTNLVWDVHLGIILNVMQVRGLDPEKVAGSMKEYRDDKS